MNMANYVTPCSDKHKVTALILCILLGMFGAHYFYVGRFGRGIIAFFTMDFFMVGWLVDIFKIATGTFTDNIGLPLRH